MHTQIRPLTLKVRWGKVMPELWSNQSKSKIKVLLRFSEVFKQNITCNKVILYPFIMAFTSLWILSSNIPLTMEQSLRSTGNVSSNGMCSPKVRRILQPADAGGKGTCEDPFWFAQYCRSFLQQIQGKLRCSSHSRAFACRNLTSLLCFELAMMELKPAYDLSWPDGRLNYSQCFLF